MKLLLFVAVFLWLAGLVYCLMKPLPPGLAVEGRVHKVSEAEFLHDLTYGRDGRVVHEQRIFARMLAEIASAKRFIILDVFLLNSVHDGTGYPPLAATLADALLRKKKEAPRTMIAVLTDPINTGYGSYPEPLLERLRAGGIQVIVTDLSRLRDPNPLYSGFWRPFVQWAGTAGSGWLPNPFSDTAPPLTLRSYLSLFNFKANHRKVLVTENMAMVTSANPHDASAFHSNIAFVVRGAVQNDMVESEAAVAALSGAFLAVPAVAEEDGEGPLAAQLLTEGAIKKELLAVIAATTGGETLWLAAFYLSDRDMRQELLEAARRGVRVRLMLDPNKDAFGRQKNGVPNRPAAFSLTSQSGGRIAVRWYDTHGEQFHAKFLFVEGGKEGVVIGGSANFTRRNLGSYNLETCLKISGPSAAPVMAAVAEYCHRLWENQGGQHTLPYEAYRDGSWLKRVLAAVQEWSGMGTF